MMDFVPRTAEYYTSEIDYVSRGPRFTKKDIRRSSFNALCNASGIHQNVPRSKKEILVVRYEKRCGSVRQYLPDLSEG